MSDNELPDLPEDGSEQDNDGDNFGFGDVGDAWDQEESDGNNEQGGGDDNDSTDEDKPDGAYIPFNNVFYAVPARKSSSDDPGVVRQHDFAHSVPNGNVLGELRKGMCARGTTL